MVTKSRRKGRTKLKRRSIFVGLLVFLVCYMLLARALTMFKASALTKVLQHYASLEGPPQVESSSIPLIFSGDYTLKLLKEPPISRVHCLSDTFSNNINSTQSAVFRSCRYDNLCFSPNDKQFIEFPSNDHWQLRSSIMRSSSHANTIHLSSIPKPVMLSAVATLPGRSSLLWMPETRRRQQAASRDSSKSSSSSQQQQQQYYMLQQQQQQQQHSGKGRDDDSDDTLLWIPIQLLCSSDDDKKQIMTQAQILFDVYLPIYTLLDIFDLRHQRIALILMGDSDDNDDNECLESMYELADLMGIAKNDIVSIHDLKPHAIVPKSTMDPDCAVRSKNVSSIMICNKISLGGIGAYASFEVPRPNNRKKGVPPTNIRRASNLRGFRTHLLSHMSNNNRPHIIERVKQPYHVVFSFLVSSEVFKLLKNAVPHNVRLSQMPSNCTTLRQQMELLRDVTVFVSLLDQDKAGAFFLPEGAVLIMLREEATSTIDLGTRWNFWNNNALIRTHLLDGKNVSQQVQAMDYIIRDEVDRLVQLDDSTKAETMTTTTTTEGQEMFAGRSVTLVHASPPATQVHCLGEKIFPDQLGADMFRSCHFDNMCFDLENKSFVIFLSPYNELLQKLNPDENYYSSVSKLLKDAPVIRSSINVSSYYKFDGVWLAMRPYSICNPGHLLWDSWLPLYTMLEMFGLEEESLLISRYPSSADCENVNHAYEAAFGFPNRTFNHDVSTILPAVGAAAAAVQSSSQYVCASHSAMGFRWLNDHGVNKHGWQPKDLAYPVNMRRGPELERFRARILRGMEINEVDPSEQRQQQQRPRRVVFLCKTSRAEKRVHDFQQESQALQQLFLPDVEVTRLDMRKLLTDNIRGAVKELAMLATTASIFVSVVGGTNAASFFLPKGASLILYGDKDLYLDFDVFNNYGHLRVHWMSLSSMHNDTQLLVDLIRDELSFS